MNTLAEEATLREATTSKLLCFPSENGSVLNITKTRLFKYTEKLLPPKNEKFQIKNVDIFHTSAQNIDCGYSLEPPRRGGSYEYPQFMFWAEIRKIMHTPVNPSFII